MMCPVHLCASLWPQADLVLAVYRSLQFRGHSTLNVWNNKQHSWASLNLRATSVAVVRELDKPVMICCSAAISYILVANGCRHDIYLLWTTLTDGLFSGGTYGNIGTPEMRGVGLIRSTCFVFLLPALRDIIPRQGKSSTYMFSTVWKSCMMITYVWHCLMDILNTHTYLAK